MRITRLKAENVMRIRAIEIEPDGNMVVISGRNGQGKSSVLNAIWLAIQGAAASREVPDPVRHGEQEAWVEVTLGDLVVTRRWSSGRASRLEVKARGEKQRSPQKLLDSLVGRLSFDPLAFASMKDADQRAALLDLVELPFDPEQMELRRQTVYDERTDRNRDVKRLEAQLAGMPEPTGVASEEVSVAVLLVDHEEAKDLARQDMLLVEAVERAKALIVVAERSVWEANEELRKCRQQLVNAEAAAGDAPTNLPDPDAILERINTAEQVNRAVRANRERDAVADELAYARDTVAGLATMLHEIDHEKEAGLREAKMPVPGLGFTRSGVTFNGIPFRQCATSERLRVSCAMAMALNPELRVIRITDGSLLDQENMAMLEELARANDYQVWIECVDWDGEGTAGVVIEDGQVAAVPGCPF